MMDNTNYLGTEPAAKAVGLSAVRLRVLANKGPEHNPEVAACRQAIPGMQGYVWDVKALRKALDNRPGQGKRTDLQTNIDPT